jgi:hypothetical protein
VVIVAYRSELQDNVQSAVGVTRFETISECRFTLNKADNIIVLWILGCLVFFNLEQFFILVKVCFYFIIRLGTSKL